MMKPLFAVIATVSCLWQIDRSVAADENPLLPADEGLVLCSKPDFNSKTCSGISKFKKAEGKQYVLQESFVMKARPFYGMTVTSMAFARDGMICVPMAKPNQHSMKLTLNGQPLNREVEANLIKFFDDQIERTGVKEICDQYAPEEVCGHKVLRRTGYLNGVAQPADLEPGGNYSIWVKPNDGFVIRKGGKAWMPPENSCQG